MKLVVLNKEEVNVEPGASLNRMSTVIENYSDLENLEDKLKRENLKVAKFVDKDVTVSTFTNMCVTDPLFIITKKDGKTVATFGIRKLTESELQENDVSTAISYLTDEQALTVKELYPTFDKLVKLKYKAEKKGYRFRDGDELYKTAQDNVTFQAQYRTGEGTESLYTHIDEAHAGTFEDPIPAKANMEYEYGKYYIEDGIIYLCERGGVENPEEMYGEKVTLQYTPSQLIGQYFKVAE